MKHWSKTRVIGGLRHGFAELCSALYPPLCWLCRSRPSVDGLGCAEHALAPCRFDAAEPRCSGCAERLPAGVRDGICARCRREPRGYRRLVACGPYREGAALREWILAFKHGGRRELARPLAAFLGDAWQLAGGPPPGVLVTSVPLHALRRFERGYDQGRLLAEELAACLDLAHAAVLRRVRWTPPPGAPGASSRTANVAGAFDLVLRRAARVAGRAVVLVDDVVTSGATARACAEVLRRAQASEVSVLALARVELDQEARDGEEGHRGAPID